jgi:hypothetical protein
LVNTLSRYENGRFVKIALSFYSLLFSLCSNEKWQNKKRQALILESLPSVLIADLQSIQRNIIPLPAYQYFHFRCIGYCYRFVHYPLSKDFRIVALDPKSNGNNHFQTVVVGIDGHSLNRTG